MAGAQARKGGRFTPVKAGLIGMAVVIVIVFFGFTRFNPFRHPFKMVATFQSANNLKPRSPVRIAGVDVGKVKKVEPIPGGKAGAARPSRSTPVTLPTSTPAMRTGEPLAMPVESRNAALTV